jgi:hypothetical protein
MYSSNQKINQLPTSGCRFPVAGILRNAKKYGSGNETQTYNYLSGHWFTLQDQPGLLQLTIGQTAGYLMTGVPVSVYSVKCACLIPLILPPHARFSRIAKLVSETGISVS